MASERASDVTAVSTTYLMCRDKGHHWIHQTDKITDGTRRKAVEVSRWWECKNCSTKQEEVIGLPDCRIRYRRYVYPDKYLVYRPADAEPIRAADVRREVFKRSGIKF